MTRPPQPSFEERAREKAIRASVEDFPSYESPVVFDVFPAGARWGYAEGSYDRQEQVETQARMIRGLRTQLAEARSRAWDECVAELWSMTAFSQGKHSSKFFADWLAERKPK